MDVSIVIVNFNAAAWLRRCVQSIEEHTRGVSYEIIVVDNASPDGSGAELARVLPRARVVCRRHNDGFSVAANEGAALASGDVLLFLNPDTLLLGDVAAALAGYLRAHAGVGAVGPRLLNPDGSVQLSCRRFPSHRTALFNRDSLATRLLPRNRFSRDYLLSDWSHAQARAVDWLSGACLMLPRDLFCRLGGWDEGYFFSIEDVDLCRRIHAAGLSVVYEPAVAVMHVIGASSRTAPARVTLARHRGMWRYYRRYLRGSPLLDALTLAGISLRCGVQLALATRSRPPRLSHRAAALSPDSVRSRA